MLELRNVSKLYSEIPAVDGVSLQARGGRGDRLPGSEWVGQVDHDEDHYRYPVVVTSLNLG